MICHLKYMIIGFTLTFLLACQGKHLSQDFLHSGIHPCLILTEDAVPALINRLENLPVLQASFEEIRVQADRALEKGVTVPVPRDPGGGYTHEQHKQNAIDLYHAGICYQLTNDDRYSRFVKQMLLEYAALYPGLGLHPEGKEQSPGKLFWQELNESVWLVYAIQGYDCVYEDIPAEERKIINDSLFRKMIDFFTVEHPNSINRIHNHGTWTCAGVGMTGIVLGDTDYVDMALYGTDKSGNAGFIRQIDELISPDGLYAEGPYYQRYAIMPFMLFAKALANNRKDLKIFDLKEGVLNKSVTTLLQLANSDGRFYPVNDALKEKDVLSPELVYAVDIAYGNTGDDELLSIVRKQGKVMISDDGLKVAEALQLNKERSFTAKSMIISDGNNGKKGGMALLRRTFDNGQLSIMLKAGSQGMGHGHFDRLSFILYENGNEIIQDYGAARFLNIEDKQGGRYLPENNSWAKQTIAHNTAVINSKSHFDGSVSNASAHHADILYNELVSEDILLVAVADSHCYSDAILQRTVALFSHNNSPVIIDVFRVLGKTKSTCDLPLYYQGQLISTSFAYDIHPNRLEAMGTANGYQHLWKVAHAREIDGLNSLTWLNNNRFYTFSFIADKSSEAFLTRIGANDPNFNLRNEPGLIICRKDDLNHLFISVIEAHGNEDPVKETVARTQSDLKVLELAYQDDDVSLISLEFNDGNVAKLYLSHYPDEQAKHEIIVNGSPISWTGNYHFITYKK